MENKNNPTLILYTLQNCYQCSYLKGELKQLGIDYTEVIIDDGSIKNKNLGDNLELNFKTKSYPIIGYSQFNPTKSNFFISKTDLEEQKGIIIFQDINDLLNKIKQHYAL